MGVDLTSWRDAARSPRIIVYRDQPASKLVFARVRGARPPRWTLMERILRMGMLASAGRLSVWSWRAGRSEMATDSALRLLSRVQGRRVERIRMETKGHSRPIVFEF